MANPTLDEFLSAARVDNPGVSDGQLASYWLKTYANSKTELPKPEATAGGLIRSFGSSAIDTVGSAFQGGGEVAAAGLRAVTGNQDIRAANPLRPVTDAIRGGMSENDKLASQDTFKGDITDPASIELPKTAGGWAHAIASGFGSLSSMILPGAMAATGARGMIMAGAATGALTTGGAAADDVRQGVQKAMEGQTPEQLAQSVPAYRQARLEGMDDGAARQKVENDAAILATTIAGAAGAVGGAFNAKVLEDVVAKRGLATLLGKVSGSRAGQIGIGAGVGVAAEGLQEGLEKVGQNVGENIGLGRPAMENATRDTAGDVIMGGLIGGVTGGVAGAVTQRRPEEVQRKQAIQDIATAPDVDSAIAAFNVATAPSPDPARADPIEFDRLGALGMINVAPAPSAPADTGEAIPYDYSQRQQMYPALPAPEMPSGRNVLVNDTDPTLTRPEQMGDREAAINYQQAQREQAESDRDLGITPGTRKAIRARITLDEAGNILDAPDGDRQFLSLVRREARPHAAAAIEAHSINPTLTEAVLAAPNMGPKAERTVFEAIINGNPADQQTRTLLERYGVPGRLADTNGQGAQPVNPAPPGQQPAGDRGSERGNAETGTPGTGANATPDNRSQGVAPTTQSVPAEKPAAPVPRPLTVKTDAELRLQAKNTRAPAELKAISDELARRRAVTQPEKPTAVAPKGKHSNMVIRQVRDRNGRALGTVMEPYDGTIEGARKAAEAVTKRMYDEFPDAGNVASRMGATDEAGNPKWAISPNFAYINPVDSVDGRATFGDADAIQQVYGPKVAKDVTPAQQEIARGSQGDEVLRAMPISTKEEASAYVKAYRNWLAANNQYGMGAMTPASAKPATLRAPDLADKARKAVEMAEENYWQMPYEVARKRFEFQGLPRAKWEAERRRRGLAVESAETEAPAKTKTRAKLDAQKKTAPVEKPAPKTEEQPAENREAQPERAAKPRLAETADGLWKAIKELAGGRVSKNGRGILYVQVQVIAGPTFQVKGDGKIEFVTDRGFGVRDATDAEAQELHDAIDGDQVQVNLMTKWGGSGRDTYQTRIDEILHSPSGNAFESRENRPQETDQQYSRRIMREMADRKKEQDAEAAKAAEEAKYQPFNAADIKKPTPSSMGLTPRTASWARGMYEGRPVWTNRKIVDFAGGPKGVEKGLMPGGETMELPVDKIVPKEAATVPGVPVTVYHVDGKEVQFAVGLKFGDKVAAIARDYFAYFTTTYPGATFMVEPGFIEDGKGVGVVRVMRDGQMIGLISQVRMDDAFRAKVRDMGSEQPSPFPVAESQAPAPSEPGNRGVAPAQEKGAAESVSREAPTRTAREIGRDIGKDRPFDQITDLRIAARTAIESELGAAALEELSPGSMFRDDELTEAIREGQYQATLDYAAAMPVPVSEADIGMELAVRAYSGTSHTPEQRGRGAVREYVRTMVDAWRRGERAAGADPEALARVTEAMTELRDGYRSRYRAYLASHGNVMSSMIAGPAKFPVRSNQKRSDTADRRASEANEFLQKGIARMLKATKAPIDNSPQSELERARKTLADREALQERMKAANAALRKGDDAALEAMGIKGVALAEFKKPDFMGRTGYPDYALKNNNAEIRRMRERVGELEKRNEAAEAGPVEHTFAGVKIEEDAQDNRIRLLFDGKPEANVRDALKVAGFRWSPNAGAWQRQLTDNARRAAEEILAKFYGDNGNVVLASRSGYTAPYRDLDGYRFQARTDGNGMPAFVSKHMVLAKAREQDALGVPKGGKAIAFSIFDRRMKGANGKALKVGDVLVHMDADGKFASFRNIEVFDKYQNDGYYFGEGVVVGMLQHNGATPMEVFNIQSAAKGDEDDALPYWKHIGTTILNNSSDPDVMIEGNISLARYLSRAEQRGTNGQSSRDSREQPISRRDEARVGEPNAGGDRRVGSISGRQSGNIRSVRAELTDAFGEAGVAALEREGILQITTWDAAPKGLTNQLQSGDHGAYWPSRKTAYIFADNLAPGQAVEVLLHEIGEHYGLKEMLGDRYDRTVAQVKTLHKAGNKAIVAAWKHVERNYDLTPGSPVFMQEVIAKAGQSADVRKMAWWQRLIADIKAFLIKVGLKNVTSERDLGILLRASVQRAMRQADGPVSVNAGAMASRLSDQLRGMNKDAGGDLFKGAVELDGKVADVTPDDEIEPRQIIEVHPVRDQKKASDLAGTMADRGWQGRPVLAWDSGNGIFAFTGSHRIAAARKADILVPVIYADADAVARQLEVDDMTADELIGSGDDRIEDFFRNAGDERAAGMMAEELRQNEPTARDDSALDDAPLASRGTIGATWDMLQSDATQRGALKTLSDLFDSSESFNVWNRTVGTQFHKAKKDADFGRVFTAVNDQIADTSRYAIEAEQEAPNILQRMESVKDIGKALFQGSSKHQKDMRVVAQAVFANIEGVEGVQQEVFTDAQLRDRFNMTDRQIELYREFRAAVDTSLDRLAQSMAMKIADKWMDASAFKSQGLNDTVEGVVAALDMQLDRLKGLRDTMAEEPAPEVRREVVRSLTVDEQGNVRQDYVKAEAVQALRTASDEDLTKELAGQIAALEEARDKVSEIRQYTDDLKERGYSPAMRFGRFSVAVGDPVSPEFFSMYETQAEANMAALALRKEYPGAEIRKSVINDEAWKMFAGVSPETVELFARFMGADETDAFKTYITLAASSRSAMKRMLERKGVAGFSWDATRVLAQFVTSNARQASINVHAGEINEALEAIPRNKGDVQKEAGRLVDYVRNPNEEAATLRNLLFMHYMGGSLASAAVNLTQPVLMTAPYLSQFIGAGKLGKIMAVAAKEAVSGNTKDVALRAALQRANADGITQPHEIHQLMADAQGSAFGKSARGQAFAKAWGGFFALSEAYNRRLTFIAAFQTAREAGKQDAYGFAVNAVYETQGLYNKANRPNWARGAIGATLFTFRQFTISYLEFVARLPMKQKLIALGVLMVAAGLEGLPFADDLEDLIDTIGQRLGYATNSKKALRKAVTGLFGDGLAEFALHGFSALPGFPLDVSGRLGMSNLIPGTRMLDPSKKDKGREVLEVFGAAGGLAKGVMDAADSSKVSDAIPTAIRNAYKGYQMMTTGEYRDSKDRKVSDVSALDAAVKMIGFQPAGVAADSRQINEQMRDVGIAKNIESEIAGDWAQGILEKDQEAVAAARQRLADWNQDNPEMPIRIKDSQILRRVKEARLTRDQRFIKTAPPEMRRRVMMEIAQ